MSSMPWLRDFLPFSALSAGALACGHIRIDCRSVLNSLQVRLVCTRQIIRLLVRTFEIGGK